MCSQTVFVIYFVLSFVFVFVFLLARSRLLIILIKCFKGLQNSPFRVLSKCICHCLCICICVWIRHCLCLYTYRKIFGSDLIEMELKGQESKSSSSSFWWTLESSVFVQNNASLFSTHTDTACWKRLFRFNQMTQLDVRGNREWQHHCLNRKHASGVCGLKCIKETGRRVW